MRKSIASDGILLSTSLVGHIVPEIDRIPTMRGTSHVRQT
jgi:hypothetical protein